MLLMLLSATFFAQGADEALFHENSDKIVIKKARTKSKRMQKQPEGYSGDALVQLVVLHIFSNHAQTYESEFMELRMKTLVELMKIQGVTTEADVRKIRVPADMARVLPFARTKNVLAPSLLLTAENLKQLEDEQGKEFAGAFKAYVKALKKAAEQDSPGKGNAFTQREMFKLIPVVVEGYCNLSPAFMAAQQPEEVRYIQLVLERVAACIYLLELDGCEVPHAVQRALYLPCCQASPEQLQQTLREAVEYNGLPRSIRSVNLKKAAEQWWRQMLELTSAE